MNHEFLKESIRESVKDAISDKLDENALTDRQVVPDREFSTFFL
jgi:hypothetical protein